MHMSGDLHNEYFIRERIRKYVSLCTKIEQQGRKHCAVVTHADGSKALYSYRTKVGRLTNNFLGIDYK
jgi:hypothetical protein